MSMNKILLILLFFISQQFTLFAQSNNMPIPGMNMMSTDAESAEIEKLSGQKSFPVGNVVDSRYYWLGPNDVLSVQINPMIPIAKNLIVTPENTLVIPRFGEIDLKNKTIAEAEKKIVELVKKVNPNAEVFISLRKARLCLVTIKGNVIFPKTYTLPASYTVANALAIVNQIDLMKSTIQMSMQDLINLRDKMQEMTDYYENTGLAATSSYSKRNISVYHIDGTSQNVDLEKAIAYSQRTDDPYLREGDVIIVPFERENFPAISISGEVMKPSFSAYKKGDMASMLLKFGRGATENADYDDVYLVCPGQGRQKLAVNENLELLEEDFPIKPGCGIIVGSGDKPEENYSGIVSIKDEIENPGIYVIEPGKTKLRELVDMAGGFTEEAYLPLAYVLRKGNSKDDYYNIRHKYNKTFQYSDLLLEDSVRFGIDIKYSMPIASCDFVECFDKNNDEENITLENGDVVVIPKSPKQIYVFGQVNNPGYVEYVPGQTMQWYIARVGGFSINADKERARIIRGKNRVWVDGSEDGVVVLDGDHIYVPSPPDLPAGIALQRYALITSVIGSLSALLALIWNVFLR